MQPAAGMATGQPPYLKRRETQAKAGKGKGREQNREEKTGKMPGLSQKRGAAGFFLPSSIQKMQ